MIPIVFIPCLWYTCYPNRIPKVVQHLIDSAIKLFIERWKCLYPLISTNVSPDAKSSSTRRHK